MKTILWQDCFCSICLFTWHHPPCRRSAHHRFFGLNLISRNPSCFSKSRFYGRSNDQNMTPLNRVRWFCCTSNYPLTIYPSRDLSFSGGGGCGIGGIPLDSHDTNLPFYGNNIFPLKVAGKIIFLFHRWDMLGLRRVLPSFPVNKKLGSFAGSFCPKNSCLRNWSYMKKCFIHSMYGMCCKKKEQGRVAWISRLGMVRT